MKTFIWCNKRKHNIKVISELHTEKKVWKSEEEDWQTVGYESRLFFGIFKALKDFFQKWSSIWG